MVDGGEYAVRVGSGDERRAVARRRSTLVEYGDAAGAEEAGAMDPVK